MLKAEHVAHIGEMRNAYKILIENYDGKRLLGTQVLARG